MKQNREVRNFLRKVRGGQCFGLAVWSGRILDRKDKMISEEEIARMMGLGFLQ